MQVSRRGLSDEKAARMMAALREGKTLRKFAVKAPRLEAYFKAHPDYECEARPLMAANAKAAFLRKGAYIREKTHCVNGHSFAEHGRVVMHKGWMTRQCRACEVMRYHRGGVIKPEVLKKVADRLKAKASLSSFTKPGSGYLVRPDTLARYRREHPDFDRLVIDVIKGSNSRAQQRRWQRIKNGVAREQNNDYYRIVEMVPRYLPSHVRDDVVQAIFIDLLAGSLRREDVRSRMGDYISAQGRMFPTKFAKFGDSPLVSLDEALYEDGGGARIDTVTRGLWD
ncbi:hypothetical protein [Bradyrhizobium sp. AZCC 1721]|uniref:hypothetical protein n=1 Tax=Bradyrhizobium sp. AZCC 1721 TaxID=3117016 RepID=UPI002FF05C92